MKYLKPWLFCFPIEVLKKRALILHKHECLGDIYDENGYKKLGDMDVLKMISLKKKLSDWSDNVILKSYDKSASFGGEFF